MTDKTLCVLVLRGLGTGDPVDLWKELTSAWGLPLINKIDSIVTRTPASQSHLLPCLVTHPASDVGGAFEAMLLCLRAAHHQLTVEEMEAVSLERQILLCFVLAVNAVYPCACTADDLSLSLSLVVAHL